MLRGLDKVTIEYGLLALAHNILKWADGLKNTCYKRAAYFLEIQREYFISKINSYINNQVKYV